MYARKAVKHTGYFRQLRVPFSVQRCRAIQGVSVEEVTRITDGIVNHRA